MKRLLGDLTEDALKAVGADKIVRYYERTTGRSCNCAARKQMLNNVHRAAQRAVERTKRQAERANLRPPVQIEEPEHKLPTRPVDEQER